MYVICDIDDVLVVSKVGDLVIPMERYGLESFKKTNALLFDLKVSFFSRSLGRKRVSSGGS
jgi:hypothetical protein